MKCGEGNYRQRYHGERGVGKEGWRRREGEKQGNLSSLADDFHFDVGE